MTLDHPRNLQSSIPFSWQVAKPAFASYINSHRHLSRPPYSSLTIAVLRRYLFSVFRHYSLPECVVSVAVAWRGLPCWTSDLYHLTHRQPGCLPPPRTGGPDLGSP